LKNLYLTALVARLSRYVTPIVVMVNGNIKKGLNLALLPGMMAGSWDLYEESHKRERRPPAGD
jgi:hypothetical protein